MGRRLTWRWAVAIAMSFGLLVVGVGPAAAARLNPRWRHVANTDGVWVGAQYVFVQNPIQEDGQFSQGGTLIDEQTGRKSSIVPPDESASSFCEAVAIGGPWLLFECATPVQTNQPETVQIELYQISTGRWRTVPQAVPGSVQGVGADWIEYWVSQPDVAYQRFVFQNIDTGQTRTLAGSQPGGHVVPDLNTPTLGRTLCAAVRVPDAWESDDEEFPGTLSFFGPYAVVAGTTPNLNAFAYLERCGTRMHRWIGPVGPLDSGYATANAHSVIWQQSTSGASDLQGRYLPSLKKFTVNTTNLVNSVHSPYEGTPNTYLTWLSARTLYVLVQPYFPLCDPTIQCSAPPSQLYAAPAPHGSRRGG